MNAAMWYRRIVALAAGCFALAACGGGGSSSSAPVPAQPKTPAAVGLLAFSILIPAPTPAAARRKPAYVSASTQSVSFQVGTATPQIVAIVPGSTNCPATNNGYVCTADASVPAGANQNLTIKTYATTNGTGAVLSQNTITVTIVAAQTNPVNVTLNGIAASLALAVTPAPSVSRCTPSTLTVTWSALDAAGNTIVGPGTITNAAGATVAPTLTTSDTTHFTIGTATGNSWPVAYNGIAGTGPMTLSATFSGVTTGTAPVAINAGSLLFTTNNGLVNMVAPPYTGAKTTISNGVYNPDALRVTSSCTLLVANYDLGEVTAYAPPYTGAPIATIAAANPLDLALTPSGNLWVLSGTPTNMASEYAPPYTGAPIATFAITAYQTTTNPRSIAVDAANDVFVVEALGFSQLGVTTIAAEYSSPYTAAPTDLGVMYPTHAIVSPATNALFLTTTTDTTDVLPPPYTTSSANIAPGNNSGSFGLALDAQSNLFIGYSVSNTVVEYAPPYTGNAAATITSGVSTPVNVAIDPATGNLFVANDADAGPTITVYAPPYTAAPSATISLLSSNGALAISP